MCNDLMCIKKLTIRQLSLAQIRYAHMHQTWHKSKYVHLILLDLRVGILLEEEEEEEEY